jgi:hypothetical protein
MSWLKGVGCFRKGSDHDPHGTHAPFIRFIGAARANDNTKLSGSECPADRGGSDAPDRAAVLPSPVGLSPKVI